MILSFLSNFLNLKLDYKLLTIYDFALKEIIPIDEFIIKNSKYNIDLCNIYYYDVKNFKTKYKIIIDFNDVLINTIGIIFKYPFFKLYYVNKYYISSYILYNKTNKNYIYRIINYKTNNSIIYKLKIDNKLKIKGQKYDYYIFDFLDKINRNKFYLYNKNTKSINLYYKNTTCFYCKFYNIYYLNYNIYIFKLYNYNYNIYNLVNKKIFILIDIYNATK